MKLQSGKQRLLSIKSDIVTEHRFMALLSYFVFSIGSKF